MTKLASTLWTSTLLATALSQPALAQTAPEPTGSSEGTSAPITSQPASSPRSSYATSPAPMPPASEEESMIARLGVVLAAGGGASGFTNQAMRDATQVGGDWDVRLTVGTRSPIAFEGSYVGSAQAIDALGLDSGAVLVGNGLQGALRVNATVDTAVQPFLYAGIGWRRYDLQADTNLSDVRGEDNVLEVPVGVGVAGKIGELILDARGEFRGVTSEDLLPEVSGTTDNFAAMHRWGVKGTLGFAF